MGSMVVNYPSVVSRYDSATEVATMQRWLGALSEPVLRRIEGLFCDSKACACYSIELNEAPTSLIAEELEVALMRVSDGHNGIWLNGPKDTELVVDPNWKQDW